MPSDPGTRTVAVVRFRALNGVEYEIDAPEAPHRISDVIAVAYDPVLPSGDRAVARTPRVGRTAIFLLIGVIALVAAETRG